MTSYATFVKVAANDPSWNGVQLPRKRGRSPCNLTMTAEELQAPEVLPLYIATGFPERPCRELHICSQECPVIQEIRRSRSTRRQMTEKRDD